MDLNPEDVRIEHFYSGRGKGSSFKVIHVPSGVSVAEAVPAGSTEPSRAITNRLISALKVEVQKKTSSEKI